MTPMRRLITILACLSAFTLAFAQDAQWGNTRFVRLSADLIVVISKGGTIEFQRVAAWDIPDAKQKLQFQNWIKRAGLPKDPGQFITDLPPEREVPVAAEMSNDAISTDAITISLKFKDQAPETITLEHKVGWQIKPSDRDVFKSFAAKLHTLTSTLLVSLAGSGKLTEEEAWGKILEHIRSANGFVTLLGGSKFALWSHTKPGVPIGESDSKPTEKPVGSLSTASSKKSSESLGSPWLLPAVGGGVVLLVGIAFGAPGLRAKILGGLPKKSTPKEAAFQVGAHERELILKVREEGQRKPPPLNAPYGIEEYAVGMVLDKYLGYDTIAREREVAQKQAEALHNYKQYQEKYEEFEKRYTSSTEALKKREAELSAESQTRKDLQDKLQKAEIYVNKLLQDQADLSNSLSDAVALLRENGEWTKSVVDRLNAQAAKIHHE